MRMEDLSFTLLRYGRILTDVSFTETIRNEIFETRITTFEMDRKIYYHTMVNGEVTECFELQ